MSRTKRTIAFGLLACAVISGATTATLAQIPDEFTNLKVLPKDISQGELVQIMRGYAIGLGVRCNHCHMGPENLQGMDFATDEKATKRTARAMMNMVNTINGTHLAVIDTGRTRKVEVGCQTCHHGLTVPAPIEDVVARKIEIDGVNAAMKEYRELREKHYGGASYNFLPIPLNSLAEKLASSEKLDEAMALITMNIEFNPGDVWTRMLMGGLHKARGDKEQAMASYQEALRIDPKNRRAQQQLTALEGDGK